MTPAARIERELMKGAAPIAVLQVLLERPMYGYELTRALRQRSAGLLTLGQSTVYPLLYNLEAKGWITSSEKSAANGRTRRYYRVTAAGRRALTAQRAQWSRLARAMEALHVSLGPATPLGRV